jgi:hypothetical protein
MKQRFLQIIAIPVLAIMAGGCAAYPTKAFVRCGPAYTTEMPTVDRVGLLVDAAVAYDRVGSTYYDVQDSETAISSLAQETEADLKTKGYDVAFVETPFVGGFKASEKSFLVATGRKDQPSFHSPPFEVSAAMNADPAYRDALLRASRNIIQAAEGRGELPTEHLRSLKGTRSAFATIAAKKNVRYLFVVQGNGTIESGGKQVLQEASTSLLSSMVGASGVSAHNVSGLDSYATLVDLRTAEALWCNSLHLGDLNPANPRHYRTHRWAYNVLYWLPPRGQLTPARKR